MAVVRLCSPLRKFSDGKPEVNIPGTTLKEVLLRIDKKNPGLADKIIEGEDIKRFVNIYVNNEDVRLGHGLSTKVGDADVISILSAISGG